MPPRFSPSPPEELLEAGHAAEKVGKGLWGGTGESFDWELLADRRSVVPLILAGGLTPDNVDEAVATVRQQLGERLVSVVPVCAAPGKEFGIDEALLPAVAQWLDEVRGVAMLRALKAEADRDRVKRVFHQLLATGKLLAEKALQAGS